MINNHGDEAESEAAAMADDFRAKRNIEAHRVWLRAADCEPKRPK